jgi:DNA repair protein RecN (Recombination protein N)
MLTQVCVRDFAIVRLLELDFRSGMTALTGETGAGKSILVEALGLALGDRADSTAIRHGCERTEVSAHFDLAALGEVKSWLTDRGLVAEDECVLRRVVTREGRSRAYVNGTPVPVQMLRELGASLVDIHGQHEHQSLLRREQQGMILDSYGGNSKRLDEVEQCYRSWRELADTLHCTRQEGADRADRLHLLRYQVEELDALGLVDREYAELETEHARLANAEQLLDTCQGALQALYEAEDGSAYGILSAVISQLEMLGGVEPRLAEIGTLLTSAVVQIEEASEGLRRYAGNVDLDPQRLQTVDERLASIHGLARKHRLEPEELPALHQRLVGELRAAEGMDVSLEELERRLADAESGYRRKAAILSKHRQKAATALGKAVSDSMTQLALKGAEFSVSVAKNDDAAPAPKGQDEIEYRVATNKGQPPLPLARVSSGGELSRISLAIQVITSNAGRVPTLIFDEVDTGIGGGTAEIVGRLLSRLGEASQVLCVTHLPQVAAQADHHYQVSKSVGEASNETEIAPLSENDRVAELARMLGGVKVTEQTLAHAREMMAQGRLSG